MRRIPDAGHYRGRVSAAPFDAELWKPVEGFGFTDITYHRAVGRPGGPDRVRPARGAQRVPAAHGRRAVPRARPRPAAQSDVGAVLLTGNGPSPKDGGWAFCSGGDQRIRGRAGYQYAAGETGDTVGPRPRPAGCTSSRCSG